MALELRLNLPCGDPIYPNAYETVNDLPGINIHSLSEIADSDLELATSLHYKLVRASESMFKNDFLLLLGKAKRILAVTDRTYKSMVGTASTVSTGYIEFNKYNLSPYIKIKVNYLIVKFTEAQTITVTITDTGEETTLSRDVVVGVNRISIMTEMSAESGRIEFEAAAGTWETGSYNTNSSCSVCVSTCNTYNLEYNIGFDIMSIVDQDAIIETYAKPAAYPHKLAYFICYMQEVLMTDRINYFGDMTRERVKEIWSIYKSDEPGRGDSPSKYGLYDKALYNMVKGVEDSFNTSESVEEIKCSGIQIIQTC